jgi:ABC-type glycerol-3-phosphate transport system substrate-binding protein
MMTSMRRPRLLGVVATLAAAALVVAGCGSGDDEESGGKITLQFSSYAWQDPTVAATKDIVAEWNAAHPDIQVNYVPVDPESVHDKLVTQFAGNSAPDIIHDEAADIASFVKQGYLADMTKLIPADLKSSIPQGVWDSVTFDGGIYGAPTLLQSYVVFANQDLLQKANVTPPTDANPWTWDQFQAAAKQLTTGGAFGLGWGLKSPTAAVLSTALNFDGTFVSGSGKDSKLTWTDAEQQVPRRIHDMLYTDKSMATGTVGMNGSEVLPGFFAGKYAMIVAGNYTSQSMTTDAPANFKWVMLPMLKGTSQAQAAAPQTMSVAAQSKHPEEAAQFIAFYANAKNLSRLAQGDWLIPASDAAAKLVAQDTQGKNGWDAMSTMGKNLKVAPFQSATPYAQWKTETATPALQQYFANKTSLDQLGQQLSEGWTKAAANS